MSVFSVACADALTVTFNLGMECARHVFAISFDKNAYFIAGCYFDFGMLHHLLAAVFHRCLFTNLPFCREQFAHLLQSSIFISHG